MFDVACDRATAPAVVSDRLEILTADQGHAAGLRALVAEALAHEGQSWSGKPPRHPEAEISIDEIRALIAAQRSRLLVAMQNEAIDREIMVRRM